MTKNVLIFCDGTGQVGGIYFDETRTNIYKLYRATRCAPDSCVDPSHQVAFYDPGIGSAADGGGLIGRFARRIYNVVAQATGLGITRNIINCYAAIIRLWQPGDRIWLFGFSRGAYTARCIGGVLALCGIPTQGKDGNPLSLDASTVQSLAKYAVKHIYQFTEPRPVSSTNDRLRGLADTRNQLADEFLNTYAAKRSAAEGTYPYFIGVFDTVAALINPAIAVGLAIIWLLLVAVAAESLALILGFYGVQWAGYGACFGLLAFVSACAALLGYVITHFKCDYGHGWRRMVRTAHMTAFYAHFYDTTLNPNVGYAKHAISIDENRAAFKRVLWGTHADDQKHSTCDEDKTPWFEQVWFAGNHADIGGGYSERESRLSDITLDWMLRCAREVPNAIMYDETVLQRWPSAKGMQHDEVATGFPWVTRMTGLSWPEKSRDVPKGAVFHRTVYDRFDAGPVMHWNGYRLYKPQPLTRFQEFAKFYDGSIGMKTEREFQARDPKNA